MDDQTDKAIAKLLNNNEHRMGMPVIRLEDGVYLIGTKKMRVKIQKNKVYVQQGGGWSLFEEYITKHDQNECIKIYRETQANDTDYYKVVFGYLRSHNASEQVIKSFGTWGDENAFLDIVDQAKGKKEKVEKR
mmetsp:Transcript_62822/g.86880  ORF Transcript_62822/g.86880 Transcript_62822/m.86880 type:complete len:133 (-) Transcript_62822:108-506(-)|eukprot:CAMPEP_0176393858 /NCGR_PEP_ID=MMETSP0126-20121128/42086_1 /TAXON_ID=141414 ORGANISM="Strombidinopsis acuminatum, Strain SPMC142" /NCGR_SAMPLE_ID=MMETSP0126 /ASSEMBLY_ACC=CAM_ASM_000229 /LENGTH=132 /DNA_ID=CAMNT_0017765671 /DNA_START=181 /DNA_END=579 /DNA_ORIENTATION=-